MDHHDAYIAEYQTLERVLNSFIRENKIQIQLVENRTFVIKFPRQAKSLIGTITYFSAFGHHRYGEQFWIVHKGKKIAVESVDPIFELLLNEMSRETDFQKKNQLLEQIRNSIQKTKFYWERAKDEKSHSWLGRTEEDRFRWMEQRLLFGHPFHPTPKSSEGFRQQDILQYAPELQAAFSLNFTVIHRDWIREGWIDSHRLTDQQLFPDEILSLSSPLLSQGYRLFPMHPWQADYLSQNEIWKKGMRQGAIVNLGQMGPLVYPTSSVRTVYSQDYPYSFKLPLHVRITHFVRENSSEQIKRTIDASRVIAEIKKNWRYPTLTLLLEQGFLQLSPPIRLDRDPSLSTSANVLFRENPDLQQQVPLVLASLLECWPNQEEPPLFDAIRLAFQIDQREPIPSECLVTWLTRYVEVAILPLLDWFAHDGISLEAHVQNTLIDLKEGWPHRLFVRDMEGVSISKERAEAFTYFHGVIEQDSPVLYAEEKAWKRLQYYLITNHLGHLIYVLAYYGRWSEPAAWKVVRECFVRYMEMCSPSVRLYISRLLSSSSLPAKANLISRFQNRSDSAVYREVPNPLHEVNRS